MSSSEPIVPCRGPLADGREVQLDHLGPADRGDLLAGFDGLSRRSRYLRFFSAMPSLPDFIVDGLLRTDAANHVAIGARLVDTTGRRRAPVVGVARYFRTSESATVAEPAIAVVDDLHHLGLGKLLLRKLSRTAQRNGITHFRAHVLDSNQRMIRLLRGVRAEIVEHDDAVLIYEIDIRRSAPAPRGVLASLLSAMQQADNADARST